MGFKRGPSSKESFDIGLHKRYPQLGDRFFVRFRLNASKPEFYPLQQKEREGQFQIAIMVKASIFSSFSDSMTTLICYMDDIGPSLGYFYADWNLEENCWVIE